MYLLPLLVIFVGCGRIEADPFSVRDETVTMDSAVIKANDEPISDIKTISSYSIVKNDEGYTVLNAADGSPVGEYADYRELRYFDDDDRIKTGCFLVENTADGCVPTRITEDGIVPLPANFRACTVYGDYIVASGILYDGNLKQIGLTYGEIESVTPLEDGGIVTFAADDEIVRSYFHMNQVDEPAGENAAAYCYGSDGSDAYDEADGHAYWKIGGIRYELPEGVRVNAASAVCTEPGTAVFLYYDDEDGAKPMACRMTCVRGGIGPEYFYRIACPIDSLRTGRYFDSWDEYHCGEVPEVTWTADENGRVRAFYGKLDAVCGGRYMLHAVPGVTTVEAYHLYALAAGTSGEKSFTRISVFDDAVVLPDGGFLAKESGQENFLLYHRDGTAAAALTYEKVLALGQYGAAVAEGDSLLFVDAGGKPLARVKGYRGSLAADKQSTRYNENEGRYYVAFFDMENPKDWIRFWYDPSTGEAGIR